MEGVIESQCAAQREKDGDMLQTVEGHANVTETALMDADVTGITGKVAAVSGGSHTNGALGVPGGETRFPASRGSRAKPSPSLDAW